MRLVKSAAKHGTSPGVGTLRAWMGGMLAALFCLPVHAGEFVNHVGMRFVDVPAGSFFMGACKSRPDQPNGDDACPSGAAADPDAYEDETPQHHVTIRAFQLGRTQVTVREFKRFALEHDERGNGQLLGEAFLKDNAGQGEMTPVVHVSWEDAQAFVAWLNRTKPQTDRGHYRLPSEAEWEYAARGGTTTPYYFGDAAAHQLGRYAWYDKNSGNRQRVVGIRRPNAFGLYDMLGNVWEWTEDCWNESYRGAPGDGSAWLQGDCSKRVVRGGSWFDVPPYLRVTSRFGDRATRRINYDGFRVARALRAPDAP